MTQAGWADTDHAARMRAEIPVGRPAASDEIASVVSFLLGAESNYMTGSILTVDGAWTA